MIKESSWLSDMWFSPSWVFMKYGMLLREIDFAEDRIKKEGRFKRVRESLAGTNMALAVQQEINLAVYVQLSKLDPPDFFLFKRTPGNEEQPWITYVEHTGHGSHNTLHKDLATQLSETKLKYSEKYEYDYILLIEVESINQSDIDAIKELINQKKIAYKIWIMEGKYQYDSKPIRIVTLNTPFNEIIVKDPNVECNHFPVTEKNPAAFLMKMSDKEVKPLPPGQPFPWPDPFKKYE